MGNGTRVREHVDEAGVALASGTDLLDVGEPRDEDRDHAGGHLSVAELADSAVPPAIDLARDDRARVVVARGDGGRGAGEARVDRDQAAVERTVSELTPLVRAPALHAPVDGEGAGVLEPGGERARSTALRAAPQKPGLALEIARMALVADRHPVRRGIPRAIGTGRSAAGGALRHARSRAALVVARLAREAAAGLEADGLRVIGRHTGEAGAVAGQLVARAGEQEHLRLRLIVDERATAAETRHETEPDEADREPSTANRSELVRPRESVHACTVWLRNHRGRGARPKRWDEAWRTGRG